MPDSPSKKHIAFDAKKIAAWQLHSVGYTYAQVADMMCVHERTIASWCREMEGNVTSALPSVKLALDRVNTMLPKALKVYEDILDATGEDHAMLSAKRQAARDLLISNKVIRDHRTIELQTDVKELSQEELIAKTEALLKKAKGE